MNEDQLRNELGDGADYRWMRSILDLFESVLGKDVSHLDIVASMYILKRYQITLADGMVINDDDDLNHTVFPGEAAFVAAQLDGDALRQDAWWKGEYGLCLQDTPEFASHVERLAVRISNSPMVVGCEKWYRNHIQYIARR